jgi:hypothetical protein
MSREAVMIGVVRELFAFLSQKHITLQDVSNRVGSIAHDPGGLVPLELHSTLPGVRAATMARYPDSDLPYTLDLTPAADARPTAGKLKSFLGDYHRARTDMGRPWRLVFHPPSTEESCRVVVIALLESGAPDVDKAPIIRVAFRRDGVGTEQDVPRSDGP